MGEGGEGNWVDGRGRGSGRAGVGLGREGVGLGLGLVDDSIRFVCGSHLTLLIHITSPLSFSA